ncbi:MAG: nitroreductase family protein [Prevotellaceae bacterium]|jgi:nitroreductase|nr:nitroreductase family protein [Prevotellaceae bacterium]
MKPINLYRIVTAVLAGMLVVTLYTKNSSNNMSNISQKDAVLENIHSRKSVRKYAEKPVSKEDLLTLVQAGMASPSSKNVQPWSFIIVTEKSVMDIMAEQLPYAKMLKTAPAAIVVCGDMSKVDDPAKSLWYLDCAMASQNILLAAEAMGLGAVYTAAYPYEDRVKAVSISLSLPATVIPLCVIPIGYGDGSEKPKDKWKPENIKWEKW